MRISEAHRRKGNGDDRQDYMALQFYFCEKNIDWYIHVLFCVRLQPITHFTRSTRGAIAASHCAAGKFITAVGSNGAAEYNDDRQYVFYCRRQ